MASMNPHQFYNDYSFTPDFYGYPTTPVMARDSGGCGGVFGATMWGTSACEESLVPFCDVNSSGASFDVVSPESDMSSSIMTVSSFPDMLGNLEEVAVPGGAFSDYGHMRFHGVAGINYNNNSNNQNFGGDLCQVPYHLCDHQFGEECCNGLMMPADVKPFGFAGQENLGINQGNQQVPTIDHQDQSTMKVGRYSEEERKERIERYLKKRNQRNFNKTIKYACRKTLADRRVRVRGRFARNGELTDHHHHHHQEMEAKKIEDDNHSCKDLDRIRSELFCSGSIQMKCDEEDWLQEAMASLLYLPYVTS